MLAYRRGAEESRARFETLCERLETECPRSDLTITAPTEPSLRERGLFFVTYAISDGAVSVGQGSGRKLVEWSQANRPTAEAKAHSHAGLTIMGEPHHDPKVRQGVTTELVGIDGMSHAPFKSREELERYIWQDAGLNDYPPPIERNGTFRQTSEGDQVLGQDHLLTGRQDENSCTTIGLLHAGRHLEGPGSELGVGHQLDLHRAHEAPAFVTCVVTGCVAQLADHGVLNVGEAIEIDGRQRDREVVGNDRLSPHTNRSAVGHRPGNPMTDLDGPDATTKEPTDRALNQPFQAPLQ